MRGVRTGNCNTGDGGGGGSGGGGGGVGEIALRNYTNRGGSSVIGRAGSSGTTTADGANSMKGSMNRGGSSAASSSSSTVGGRRLTTGAGACAGGKSVRGNVGHCSNVADAGAVHAVISESVHNRGFSESKKGSSSFAGNDGRSNSSAGMRSDRIRSSGDTNHVASTVLANHATSRALNHLSRVSISPNSRMSATVSSFASNTNVNSSLQQSGATKIAATPPNITSSSSKNPDSVIPQPHVSAVAAMSGSENKENGDLKENGVSAAASQETVQTVQATVAAAADSAAAESSSPSSSRSAAADSAAAESSSPSSSRSAAAAYYPQPHPGLKGAPPAANYIAREWMKGPSDSEGTMVNVSDRPSLCMSVRGTEACIGSSDHALYIIDCQQKKFLRSLYGKQYGHMEWVTCVDYLHDGRILSGGMDSKLCLWDKKGVRCHDLKGHTASISAVKAGAEGSLAVSSSYDKTLMLWDLSRLQIKSVGCLKGHKGAVMGFALSSQGSIVSGSREGEVILWDAARATALLHCKDAHEGHVTALECLEDIRKKSGQDWKELFLTGGQDGILQVWDFRAKAPVQSVALHRNNTEGKGALSNIAVSYTATGSGPIVVTAGADNNLKVLDPRKSFEVLHTLSSHRDFIYSLHVSGPLVWSGGGDGTLLVHELLTGQCLYGLGATANGAVRCISLVGQDRLVVAGDDGNVMIYSI